MYGYKDLVEKFLSVDTNVTTYREALRLLKRCGFFDMLRRGGYPSVTENGSNIAAMAHEGSWSNGYQTAMSQVEHFEELYANKPDQSAPRVNPDFGGKKLAVREGYLTEEEIKKFK